MKNPAYHNIGDHAETIQIEFDPAKISYKEMLGMFFSQHNACATPWSRQYMSAIFYHSAEQKKLEQEAREKQGTNARGKVATEISECKDFWPAEDYHQKYVLRNSDLMREFKAMYPKESDFVKSTAAARVNAYLSGAGKLEDLKADLPNLGLSDEAQKRLLREFNRR